MGKFDGPNGAVVVDILTNFAFVRFQNLCLLV